MPQAVFLEVGVSVVVHSLAEMARALQGLLDGARRVLLTGPSDPDGDSIGACLALAGAIRQRCAAEVTVSGRPGFRYAWLEGAAAMLPDGAVLPDHDVVIVVDGDRHRLHPAVETAFAAARHRVILDHHHSTRPRGYELAWVDPGAASTCELVLGIVDAWGLALDRPMAEALYTGIVFDTGGFRHPNTTPATHAAAGRLLAAGVDHSAISLRVLWERRRAGMGVLGEVLCDATTSERGRVVWATVSLAQCHAHQAEYADLEGMVDILLLTRGVELSCLLIERAPGQVKLSLRSRSTVDVAALARSLDANGGGHQRAAGVVLGCTLDEARQRVPPALAAALHQAEARATA